MADTETTLFKFLLDDEEFVEKLLHSKGLLEELGDKESLSGLIEGLTKAGVVLGAVGAAMYAVKTAVDWVEEAEKIRQVNAQFEMMTKQAGISTEALKHGLEEAAGGLISTGKLLEIANKSLTTMGGEAARLPEVMELARQATAIFGGDLAGNFEQLNQALAVGNNRMLKHFGIVIDNDAAVRKYAAGLGVAVESLSEAGKRQALFNAGLEQGQKNFDGVNDQLTKTRDTIQSLSVAFTEMKEVFLLVFEKTLGPTIRSVLDGLASMATKVKTQFTSMFGEGEDKARAHLQGLKDQLSDLDAHIEEIKGRKSFLFKLLPQSEIDRTVQDLAKVRNAYQTDIEKIEKEFEKLEAKTGKKNTKDSPVDKTKEAAAEAKFYSELTALQLKYQDEVIASETKIANVEANLTKKKLLIEQQHIAAVKKLRADKSLTTAQAATLEQQLEKNKNQQIQKLEKQTFEMRKAAIKNLAKENQTAMKGFVNGWAAASQDAAADLDNMSAHGAAAAGVIQGGFVAAFAAMADGSMSAGDAMKKAILKSLGEQAVAKGSTMILAGLWPPNPLAIAGGGALVALGTRMGAISSGIGATPSGGGGVPAATEKSSRGALELRTPRERASHESEITADTAPTPDTAAPALAPAQAVTAKRHVTVQFMGDFINTDQTRQKFLDMMRKETDATDFKYVQVGKS